MKTKTQSTQEWVALSTFTDRQENLREAGAIYRDKPGCSRGEVVRPLIPGEPVVACPRCGQRFADSDDGSAASCRDLHFRGDEECPSICDPASWNFRPFNPRQSRAPLRLVE